MLLEKYTNQHGKIIKFMTPKINGGTAVVQLKNGAFFPVSLDHAGTVMFNPKDKMDFDLTSARQKASPTARPLGMTPVPIDSIKNKRYA